MRSGVLICVWTLRHRSKPCRILWLYRNTVRSFQSLPSSVYGHFYVFFRASLWSEETAIGLDFAGTSACNAAMLLMLLHSARHTQG